MYDEQIHRLHDLVVFKAIGPDLGHFYYIEDSIIEVPVGVLNKPHVLFLPTQWLKAGM